MRQHEGPPARVVLEVHAVVHPVEQVRLRLDRLHVGTHTPPAPATDAQQSHRIAMALAESVDQILRDPARSDHLLHNPVLETHLT